MVRQVTGMASSWYGTGREVRHYTDWELRVDDAIRLDGRGVTADAGVGSSGGALG